MPMGKEHLFPFENMETITDEELKRIGMFAPNSTLLMCLNIYFMFHISLERQF
jgi:hypothetical protein